MEDIDEALTKTMELIQSGYIKKATESCDKILEEQPDSSNAYHLKGYIALLQGDPELAKKDLLVAISLNYNDASLHNSIGIAYREGKDIPKAKAAFRIALKLDPSAADTMINLAKMYESEMRMETAMDYCNMALEVSSEYPEALNLIREIKQKMNDSILQRLRLAIPPNVGRGKRKVVYVFRAMSRIGHIIFEPWFLKNLYDPDEFDIIFIVPKGAVPINQAVFDIATRDTFVVETADSILLNIWNAKIGVFEEEDCTFVLDTWSGMVERLVNKQKIPAKFLHFLHLNDKEQEEGLEMRKNMGIPEDARIVTLYVREQGFLKHMIHHVFRNSDIENYIPAIKYLVDQGFYIVRIGDDKMKPLPDLGPQVIDAPFHPAVTKLVESYFASCSDFMIKTISGPDSLSFTLNVPALITNLEITPHAIFFKKDLVIFRKYYSHTLERYLSFREIVTNFDLLQINEAQEFTKRHIELRENTPEELLAATKEMLARLRGEHKEDKAISDKFSSILQQADADMRNNIYNDREKNLNMHSFGAKISDQFCKLFPEFLD